MAKDIEFDWKKVVHPHEDTEMRDTQDVKNLVEGKLNLGEITLASILSASYIGEWSDSVRNLDTKMCGAGILFIEITATCKVFHIGGFVKGKI